MASPRLTPLSIVLCVLFLFSANVFAVSAVLGVDLGTEYIKAALVKPGIPLEIVLTKDSRRKEMSAVAFKPSRSGPKAGSYPERLYGSDAMALAPRFPGDVYLNLKALLGLPVETSEVVKDYAARHPALQLVAHKTRGTSAFRSADAFTAEEEAWLVEELLAMELLAIQRNAEELAGPGISVKSVVLTVPPFYTVEEKRAVQLAANLAGLRVLSLISDGLAVGLNYATTRTFPNLNEGAKPEHHMVFDMGAGSTKATVMRFQSRTVKDVGKYNKTIQEVIVLGSGWDRTLGGDALNALIVGDMVSTFVESAAAKKAGATAEGVTAHGRAVAKLSKDAERARHVLSANTNTGASFEGLYDDVNFKYKITRTDFEKMAEGHADRVAAVLQRALEVAGLDVKDIDSVILHGGASRTPFVQKQLEKVVGSAEKIRTNVNSDEAAVFGAGFRAAELSPSFRVKEIRIAEGSVYPAGMKWTNSNGKAQHQMLWTATSTLGAAAKEVTFANQQDFSVKFYQQVPTSNGGTEDRETKVMTTKNLTASVSQLADKHNCLQADIQLKVSLRLSSEDGEVDVVKATVECEGEEAEKEGFVDGVKNLFGFGNKKDQQPLKDDASAAETLESSSSTSSTLAGKESGTASSSAEAVAAATDADAASASPKAKTKKLIVIPVNFLLEKAGMPQLDASEVLAVKDRIKAFEASDVGRRQREAAANQLEGYTYKARDVLESESFIAVSTVAEREALEAKNSEVSDWLYGDGTEATRDELKAKLKELRDIVEPVEKRIDEASKRPESIAGLRDALKQTIEFVTQIREKIAESEAWSSSKLAADAAAATASADSKSSTTTTPAAAAESSGDFDGLEDEDARASTTAAPVDPMEEVIKERGPVPPLYTDEDLRECEELYKSISAWLDKQEAAQAALPSTADPVLTVAALSEKRAALDKAGMDLAMKGVKNYEKKQSNGKKGGSSSKNKSSKVKKAKAEATGKTGGKKAAGTDDSGYVKFGGDAEMPSEEEILEALEKYNRQQQDKKKAEGGEKIKHDEL